MTTEYYVEMRTSCEKCNKKGLVQAPIWRKYWNWVYLHGNKRPTIKETQGWFVDEGYPIEDEIPEEEESCPDCDGNGWITEQVELSKALGDLIETLDIMVGHPHERG